MSGCCVRRAGDEAGRVQLAQVVSVEHSGRKHVAEMETGGPRGC